MAPPTARGEPASTRGLVSIRSELFEARADFVDAGFGANFVIIYVGRAPHANATDNLIANLDANTAPRTEFGGFRGRANSQ